MQRDDEGNPDNDLDTDPVTELETREEGIVTTSTEIAPIQINFNLQPNVLLPSVLANLEDPNKQAEDRSRILGQQPVQIKLEEELIPKQEIKIGQQQLKIIIEREQVFNARLQREYERKHGSGRGAAPYTPPSTPNNNSAATLFAPPALPADEATEATVDGSPPIQRK